MGKINISAIYACIEQTLRNDSEIQAMLGLSQQSTPADWQLKIQKRKKPEKLAVEHFPILSFYKNPGSRGDNYLEYRFIVDFDIYTQGNVELATNIADRVVSLFDDKFLGLKQGSVFKGQYITSAEDDTDLANTYKYFTQIGLTIGIDENG
ncbi:hypothetical protein [Paenibacillus arenosi]|uniref:DUF3168 domain-containing protein n=1 Tax=Paenibacillus arenosi TaxID=2774142 RepID=A0ABR9AXM8_9BACL|nr:hypothetical protein [Paenibacillus arenosi]MBD8498894.1 hypothetical protein [Paenibacillus arenosi]